MNEFSPNLFYGSRPNGIPDEVLDAAWDGFTFQRDRGLTPILTLGHLASLVRVDYSVLRGVVDRSWDPYEDLSIPKKRGGRRELSRPHPLLMVAQKWILANVLSNLNYNDASFAYTPGRSIVHCARRHVGARWLLKLDIKDFFDSVDEISVYKIFRSLGYEKLISLELARLCTRVTSKSPRFDEDLAKYNSIFSYRYPVKGQLPQGAPTSGALANAAMIKVDQTLQSIVRRHRFTYTRYSDDLVFSTSSKVDRFQLVSLKRDVERELSFAGFRLRQDKTRIIPPGARKIVLGLLIDENSVRLTPEFKRRVNTHLRGVEKFGLVAHVQHRKFRSIFSFVNHVEGLLEFARNVEPSFAEASFETWRELVPSLDKPSS
ncbi:Reverse transcriptase (RNA-dependent DNA polymerase) [Corynebacterium faecale]|uniref:reverse transcriptase family protein n=1 Tax=Corynebacterium faecale TaxID=1758466 RepID=UPI0025B298FA|nr:reverse transcriptase family protein [Corynebacterium faecale]WJY91157.1 Reverse transcriptase (RNA-dependent DNA polymerase) [Corynebacterium faecale]